jgi:hypothetical protein
VLHPALGGGELKHLDLLKCVIYGIHYHNEKNYVNTSFFILTLSMYCSFLI